MPTEADTCRKFVVPKLQAAGWDDDPHSIVEQRSITDGRISFGCNNRGKPTLRDEVGAIGPFANRRPQRSYWNRYAINPSTTLAMSEMR